MIMKLKSLSLALAIAAGTIPAFAQAPTVPAPTPAHSPDKVKSSFSDAYTPFTKWDRQHGATMETITINGDDQILKFTGDYVAVSVGGRKLNDMEYMHADVYAPETGGVSQVRFGFALFSGGEKYADAYNTDTPAGKWTSIDIPLSAFNGYDFSNAQVFRMTMTKTPGNTFYMDNVYFYTTRESENTLPAVAAPTPKIDAANVRSCYSDAYTSSFEFNGYNNNGCQITSREIAPGEHVLEIKDFRWIHFALGKEAGVSTVDLSGLERVHFDVYVPENNVTTAIQPGMYNVASKKEAYSGKQNLTPGKWVSVDLKMQDFQNVGLSAVNNITFKDPAGKTGIVYLDNVYFYNGSPVVDPDPDPDPDPDNIPVAPVPTQDAADVKAFFSDAYPNLFGKFEIANYGEGTVEILDQAEGQQVCRITNFNWVPVNLGQRDVSDKGYVHFDMYTPASDAVASVNVGFQNWNAANGSAYEIEGEDFNYRALVPGQWNSFDIPLDNFRDFDFATQMAVLRLRKGGSGKTLYVDNVYFWGKPGEGPIDPPGPGDEDIQDPTPGELPDMNTPMLGVNLSSASGGSVPGTFGFDYMYPRIQDLRYFKAKGARLIRLPFRAARFIEDLKNPAPDYANAKSDVAAMKEVVAEAERLGMWVFLDAHDYAERTIDGTQYKIGEGEYTIDRFAKMWGAIANEFKDYKNIWGYDLQNEPKVNAQTLVEAYQAAIDEIRKVDTNAQIIVEGTNWASAYEWIYGDHADKNYPGYSTEVEWSYKENSPWLLAGLKDPQNKIVFQAHGYFDKDNSGTYKNGYTEVDYRKRFLPFLEWCRTNNVKGLIGEFGVPYNGHSSGDPRYMDILDGALQLFREYGMNATYWCAGAMYESNSLTCQPDKSALGNYLPKNEKSTMKVLEKYFNDWAQQSGIPSYDATVSQTGDGRTYNLMGVEVDENYVGIVIRDGKKYIQK
jgi:endoglucanase